MKSYLINIPNIITLTRIFITLFIFKYPLICISIGSLSDFLDGFLARRLSQTSRFGAILDVVADKIFIFMIIMYLYYTSIIHTAWIGLVLIREMILMLRYICFYSKVILQSRFIGKLYVGTLMIGSIILIYNPFLQWLYMLLTGALCIMSIIDYLLYIV